MNTLFSIFNVLIERYYSMSTKLVFESLIIERPDVLRRNSKDKNTMAKRKSTKRLNGQQHHFKDWATWTPLKNGGELNSPGKENDSCSRSGIRRVPIAINPVLIVMNEKMTASRLQQTCSWSFLTQTFCNG